MCCIQFLERRGAFDFGADLGNFIGNAAVVGVTGAATVAVALLAYNSFANAPAPTAIAAALYGLASAGFAVGLTSGALAVAGATFGVYMLYSRVYH